MGFKPFSYLVTSATAGQSTCSHCTLAHKLCDMWRFTPSQKSRHHKRSCMCVNRSPILYGFCTGEKAIRYGVNTYPICFSTLRDRRGAAFAPLWEISPKQKPHPLWFSCRRNSWTFVNIFNCYSTNTFQRWIITRRSEDVPSTFLLI